MVSWRATALERIDKPSKSSKTIASTKVGKKYAQSAERKHDMVSSTLSEPPSKFIALASAARSVATVQFLVGQVVTQ